MCIEVPLPKNKVTSAVAAVVFLVVSIIVHHQWKICSGIRNHSSIDQPGTAAGKSFFRHGTGQERFAKDPCRNCGATAHKMNGWWSSTDTMCPVVVTNVIIPPTHPPTPPPHTIPSMRMCGNEWWSAWEVSNGKMNAWWNGDDHRRTQCVQ